LRKADITIDSGLVGIHPIGASCGCGVEDKAKEKYENVRPVDFSGLLYRNSEDIRIEPIIIVEPKFGDIARQVSFCLSITTASR
jgi:hypothetical protein